MGLYPVTVCCSARQDSTVQYSTIQYSAITSHTVTDSTQATLYTQIKKKLEHVLYTIKTQKRLEFKI